jgi:hypothetical protein
MRTRRNILVYIAQLKLRPFYRRARSNQYFRKWANLGSGGLPSWMLDSHVRPASVANCHATFASYPSWSRILMSSILLGKTVPAAKRMRQPCADKLCIVQSNVIRPSW